MLPMGHGQRDHRAVRPHRRLAPAGEGARHDRRGRHRVRPHGCADRTHQHRHEHGPHRARGRPGRARPAHRRPPGPRREPGHLRHHHPRGRRPRRRAPGRLLLHHQPGHGRARRRPLAGGREPGDGLRHRDRRRASSHDPDAPGQGRRPDRRGQRRGPGARTGQAAGRVRLRVHEQRGVLREAEGADRPAGGGADPCRPRSRREGAGRVRSGRRAHRRCARTSPGSSTPGGSTCCSRATASPPTTSSRTCSAPRSACSLAEGTLDRGRALEPPPGDQRGASPRLDRGRRRVRVRHRRGHGDVRPARRPLRAGRVDPRRRARSPTCTSTRPTPPTPCERSSPG